MGAETLERDAYPEKVARPVGDAAAMAQALDLRRRLDTLVIFRDLLQDPAIKDLSLALGDCVKGRQERFLR